MTDPNSTTGRGPDQAPSDQPTSGAPRETPLSARLPPQVKEQPDPFLQMSVGWMGLGGITLVALTVGLILFIVFYGLNSPATNAHNGAATSSSAQTTPPAHGSSGAATPGAQRPNRGGA